MHEALSKPPRTMTVPEFLLWPGDGSGRRFQLVDGAVRPIPLDTTTRGAIQATLGCLIADHLSAIGSRCRGIFRPPIVPRVRASLNLRTPALAVTADPDRPDQYAVEDVVLIAEVLSPGNTSDTWDNVWAYTTIPSVREIAVVHSTRVLVEMLRRGADGHWPEEPEQIGPDGTLRVESIDFDCRLEEVYVQTHLA